MEDNMVMTENPVTPAAPANDTVNLVNTSKKKPSNLIFLPVILLFVAGVYLVVKDMLPKSAKVETPSNNNSSIAANQEIDEDTIYFAQPFQTVQVGDETKLEIAINTKKDVNAFELTLVFDPEVLEVDLSGELGPFLSSTGRIGNILGPVAKEVPGKIKVGGFSYGDQPSSTGDGVLVVLTARALKSGSAVLQIEDSIVVGTTDDPHPEFSVKEAQILVN